MKVSSFFQGAFLQAAFLLLLLMVGATAPAQTALHLTHEYANVDVQSLIGLPMGDHKTIVDRDGNLKWSQWSLARRGKDVPIGFSAQMDAELGIAITAEAGSHREAFKVTGQSLHQGRYPFIVTHLALHEFTAEETAFAVVDHGTSMDVVWIEVKNPGGSVAPIHLHLSGKQRNLPAYAGGAHLATHDGLLLASLTPAANSGEGPMQANGFELVSGRSLGARSAQSFLVRLPYDYPAAKEQELPTTSGPDLLAEARGSWDDFWAKGMRLELPTRLSELEDFYWSSLAYTLILTERDVNGELWTLDGPAVYREFWGRGEYFQGRAIEAAGYLDIGKETVRHTLSLQKDDGEWDWPVTSGWPAWDNIGGNAASVWDYYLYSRDRQWLAATYPYLARAADWIRLHREESMVPEDAPAAAQPIHRQIPWKCSDELEPALAPGEKHYWYGLLPWSYGDSGLPEGHPFPHNVWALYAVNLAAKAAEELGKPEDAARYRAEYAPYKDAILESMKRSIALEKEDAPYLPAMPTLPDGAVSQSFVAVYPTSLLAADDPWVSNLLTHMSRTDLQGLPANMAWMGFGGVWPGESLNVAETYLRRGDIEKTISLLKAALNHSYSTNVFKEEIKVDKRLPVACKSGNAAKVEDGHGTGDMPEAWGNANLVLLVRDMLLREDGDTLRLLTGIPARWIGAGEEMGVQAAPTTFGAPVSLRLRRLDDRHLDIRIETTPGLVPAIAVHLPLAPGQQVESVRVNGAPAALAGGDITVRNPASVTEIEVALH
jgi:hypothetical protein